jgi:hypothetical protein
MNADWKADSAPYALMVGKPCSKSRDNMTERRFHLRFQGLVNPRCGQTTLVLGGNAHVMSTMMMVQWQAGQGGGCILIASEYFVLEQLHARCALCIQLSGKCNPS